MDPAAEATILNASVRPYRDAAAAASDEDGRGVGHGRGYKAGRFQGQAKTRCIPTIGATPDRISAALRVPEINQIGTEFLHERGPDWQPVFDVDKPLAVQTRRKLYDMAIAEKMPIQAFHPGFPGQMRVEKDGNGYRWIPVVWNASL